MKGQISYVIKPLTLVMIIILLIFLLQSLYSYRGREKLSEKNLDIVGTATSILLILSNSKDCLSFEDLAINSTQSNIIDIDKLNYFSNVYSNIEPDCARNYDLGWRVNVTEINRDGKVVKNWNFGAKEFSKGKALKNKVEFWIPVAIRYSEDDIRLGRMTIELVDGELEKLAGFFDWSCKLGRLNELTSTKTEIFLNEPVSYDSQRNELCVGTRFKSCRKLSCDLVYFDGFKTKGTYSISVKYKSPDKLLVSK